MARGGGLYTSSKYAGLKIERQEKHSSSIGPKSEIDPIDLPRAQPLDEDDRKQYAKDYGEEVVRDWVIVPSVIWVFRVSCWPGW